jgi:hypothetical protein
MRAGTWKLNRCCAWYGSAYELLYRVTMGRVVLPDRAAPSRVCNAGSFRHHNVAAEGLLKPVLGQSLYRTGWVCFQL